MNRIRGGLVVLLVTATGGCVTPALNRGAFVENAKAALESTVSVTASARLAVDARRAGDATRPFSDTVVTDSEQQIPSIQTSFGGVDPPSAADDALRRAVLDLIGQAGAALADARIAVRRGDLEGMTAAVEALARVTDQLRQLRQSLE